MLEVSFTVKAKIERGLIFLILSTLNLSSVLYVQNPKPLQGIQKSEVYKAASHLDVLIDCPDRLWPGFSWQNYQVTFEDPQQSDAVRWNSPSPTGGSQDNRISLIPQSSVLALTPGAFILESSGILLSRRPKEAWQELVETAIHETFHRTQKIQNIFRDYIYPEDWQPRYLRQEIIRSLHDELTNVGTDGLARSKFWRMRWERLYPDDIGRNQGMDFLEGPAKFVGQLGVSLATLGCDASNTRLITNAVARMNLSENFERAEESYRLGLLVGLLLERGKVNAWHERVTRGEMPLNILLENTQPQKDGGSFSLKRRVKVYYQRKNSEVREIVAGYKHDLGSTEYVPLAIPAAWLVGSFQSRPLFIKFDFTEGVAALMSVDTLCQFRKPDASASISIKGENIAQIGMTFGGEETIYYIFSVPANALKGDPSGYSINSEHVVGSQLELSSVQTLGIGSVRVAY